MYSTFSGFGSYFKKKNSLIDNATFRLHYRVTFGLLVLGSLLVTLSQFFGKPIQCIASKGVSQSIFETYCWIHGTFTIPSQLAGTLGVDFSQPGIGPEVTERMREKGHVGFTQYGDEIRHAWYQWVCFILFIQAVMCYLPHYIWKTCEGGKLSMLIQGLDLPMLDGVDGVKDKRQSVVNYFLRTFRSHNSYVYKFLFCEVLNLVNILFQIYLMDFFFGGQFSKYGAQVLSVSETAFESRDDPMNRVFPKVTKCTFHKYGSSGTVEKHDGLCVLAMNIINEKIYIFLWFWFVALSVWTALQVMFRIITVASSQVRWYILTRRVSSVNKSDISTVVKKCYYGDWFLLMQMSKHINPAVFHDIVLDLRDRMDQKRAENLSENEK